MYYLGHELGHKYLRHKLKIKNSVCKGAVFFAKTAMLDTWLDGKILDFT